MANAKCQLKNTKGISAHKQATAMVTHDGLLLVTGFDLLGIGVGNIIKKANGEYTHQPADGMCRHQYQ